MSMKKKDETSSSHTLLSIIESDVKKSDGAKCKLCRPTRRHQPTDAQHSQCTDAEMVAGLENRAALGLPDLP